MRLAAIVNPETVGWSQVSDELSLGEDYIFFSCCLTAAAGKIGGQMHGN